MAGDWSDEQNDAIVADYFAMLGDDIVRRPYSKTEHNRLLQAVIDRSRGSIEYKHQNISAALKGLGEDWIPGYKPAFNFQVAEERRSDWRLVRLWNFAREPKAFELRPPLEAHVSLMATSYQANFL